MRQPCSPSAALTTIGTVVIFAGPIPVEVPLMAMRVFLGSNLLLTFDLLLPLSPAEFLEVIVPQLIFPRKDGLLEKKVDVFLLEHSLARHLVLSKVIRSF